MTKTPLITGLIAAALLLGGCSQPATNQPAPAATQPPVQAATDQPATTAPTPETEPETFPEGTTFTFTDSTGTTGTLTIGDTTDQAQKLLDALSDAGHDDTTAVTIQVNNQQGTDRASAYLMYLVTAQGDQYESTPVVDLLDTVDDPDLYNRIMKLDSTGLVPGAKGTQVLIFKGPLPDKFATGVIYMHGIIGEPAALELQQ